MRLSNLKKLVGQVVVLDLVTDTEITTKIHDVTDDGYVMCSKPRVFVPMQNPNNPNETQVLCLEYGYPLYQAPDMMEIEAAHVFTAFTPSAEQIEHYAQKTSSLVPAGANVLDQLDKKVGNLIV